jgi:hypothetical protein
MLGNSIAKFFKLDSLVQHLTGYVETKVEIVKLELKRDLTSGLSKGITYLLIAFVFAMVLLFLSFGTAIVLSGLLGDFWGFAIVATFYLVIGIVLYANRKSLIKQFEKQLSETTKTKK